MDGTTLKVPSANQTLDLARPSRSVPSPKMRSRSSPGPESNSSRLANLDGKSKLRSVGDSGKVCWLLSVDNATWQWRRRTWCREVFFGKAINTCGPRSAITAPEDELGVAIVSVILFFMSPMAFRTSAVATLPLWVWSGDWSPMITSSPSVESCALQLKTWYLQQRHCVCPFAFSRFLQYS